uniref:Uncharacterized protein n=1 Tax=Anguilla anguilla TaxID=7936 RepID=A0A0E9T5H9_ANGAN
MRSWRSWSKNWKKRAWRSRCRPAPPGATGTPAAGASES